MNSSVISHPLRFALIKCAKCGQQFSPATQFGACRGRGDPLKHQSCVELPSLSLPPYGPAAKKAAAREPFQSDFRLLWDERPSRRVAP